MLLGPAAAYARGGDAPFDADVGLDPGHSHVDVGAAGAGVGEYQHTLDVALRVKPLLEAAGLSVNLSRMTSDSLTAMSDPDTTERTRIEELARIQAVGNVRIFISIHFNAGAAGDPRLSGTETYYNTDNAGDDSFRLATALQRNVLASLADYGYQAVDRGVKNDLVDGKPYGHFFSLRGGMPSALVESLFLSNPTESRLLLEDETRQAIAQGFAGGIVDYFGTPSPAAYIETRTG
jgi:N-acetylmuramoyl-L-alanine amidase